MPVPDSHHAPYPAFSYLPNHLFPNNAYTHHPAQPAIAHRVWILDCASCRMFLTNRGMKAVLLLRPNVSLYSSDVLPVNCSAHNSSPDAVRPPMPHKPYASPGPARTCECLTQSLFCHGCGNTIGYKIVIPCARCTSSISATNRATNGHRFVFHSSEVTGTERHYVEGEPGVISFDSPPAPLYHDHPSPPFSSHAPRSPNLRTPSPALRADYLPTPPLEFATPQFVSSRDLSPDSDSSPDYYRIHSPHSSRSPPPFGPIQSHRYSSSPSHYQASDEYSSASSSPPPLFNPNAYPADHKEPLITIPSLKSGDLVFWHHLARSGEIPGVTNDDRARRPTPAKRPWQTQFNR